MSDIDVYNLGVLPYESTLKKMRDFTLTRNESSRDQVWVLEHDPVFTFGQNAKPEHLLQKTETPVVHSDRGGQITYHGPGQLIIYPLLKLDRYGLNVRSIVDCLEESMIDVLAGYDISAYAKKDAPGVYVDNKKIGSIGLRIKRGYSYHGLSFNIDMDLAPFQAINPCGYENLQMTQLRDFVPGITVNSVSQKVLDSILNKLNSRAKKPPESGLERLPS